ncbi:hypothetical protein RJ55_06500 [Drechmeria coniospora]|nr:hypothetical protein RJ55_06500 [Drechmeria coniospora]
MARPTTTTNPSVDGLQPANTRPAAAATSAQHWAQFSDLPHAIPSEILNTRPLASPSDPSRSVPPLPEALVVAPDLPTRQGIPTATASASPFPSQTPTAQSRQSNESKDTKAGTSGANVGDGIAAGSESSELSRAVDVIVILGGCLGFVLLILAAAYLCHRRRRQKKRRIMDSEKAAPPPEEVAASHQTWPRTQSSILDDVMTAAYSDNPSRPWLEARAVPEPTQARSHLHPQPPSDGRSGRMASVHLAPDRLSIYPSGQVPLHRLRKLSVASTAMTDATASSWRTWQVDQGQASRKKGWKQTIFR